MLKPATGDKAESQDGSRERRRGASALVRLRLSPSICRSQDAIRFQLALFWSTILSFPLSIVRK